MNKIHIESVWFSLHINNFKDTRINLKSYATNFKNSNQIKWDRIKPRFYARNTHNYLEMVEKSLHQEFWARTSFEQETLTSPNLKIHQNAFPKLTHANPELQWCAYEVLSVDLKGFAWIFSV